MPIFFRFHHPIRARLAVEPGEHQDTRQQQDRTDEGHPGPVGGEQKLLHYEVRELHEPPARGDVDGDDLGHAPFDEVAHQTVVRLGHAGTSRRKRTGVPTMRKLPGRFGSGKRVPGYLSCFGRTKCSRVPLAPGRSAQLEMRKEMTASAPVGYFRVSRAIFFLLPKTE